MWKKLASAFVEFEETEKPPAGGDTSVEEQLADTEALLRELGVSTDSDPTPIDSPAPPSAPASNPPTPTPTDVPQEISFEQIYAQFGVPKAPKTVEEVLKVLAGLAALPQEAQKTAIAAMDEADDNWTIDDVLLDGKRKVEALKGAKADFDVRLRAREEAAANELAAQDKYIQDATAEIRGQIAELEKLLAEQVAESDQAKGRIHGELQAARDACARNHTKLDAEINRITPIMQTFGGAAPKVN